MAAFVTLTTCITLSPAKFGLNSMLGIDEDQWLAAPSNK